MRDVIELVVTLGDTTLEHRFVELAKHRVADLEIDPPSGTDWVHRKRGLVDVAVRRAPAPAKHALAAAIGDRRSAGYVAISLAAHLLVWGVAYEPEPTVTIEPPKQVFARIADRVPVRGAAITDFGVVSDAIDGGGAPSLGLSVPGSTRRGERAAAITREQAIEAARHASVLGSVALYGASHVGGSADLSAGFEDVAGGIVGGERDHGSFGSGRTGVGGGCDADCGTILAGRYSTIGAGRGTGQAFGTGERERGLAQRGPMVIPCAGPRPCVIATGGLDKAVIRRYIRRELPKIQYCYERELLANDRLSGEVETHFLIQVDGHVSTSEASGISPAVSTCVAGVIKNIVFPRSIDGISEVHYPFTFHTAGS